MIDLFLKYKEFYFSGLLITLALSFLSVLAGTIIGLILSMMRLSSNKLFRFLATSYVEVIIGTPLIVQLFIALGLLAPFKLPLFLIAFIACGLNSGAYVCEIIRSGIQSVDKGQTEAGRSLGMSKRSVMNKIILPQALKNILPALCSEFVTVIKETSVAALMGTRDLYYAGNAVGASSYRTLHSLYVVAVIYFVVTFSLSKAIRILEMRLKQVD